MGGRPWRAGASEAESLSGADVNAPFVREAPKAAGLVVSESEGQTHGAIGFLVLRRGKGTGAASHPK